MHKRYLSLPMPPPRTYLCQHSARASSSSSNSRQVRLTNALSIGKAAYGNIDPEPGEPGESLVRSRESGVASQSNGALQLHVCDKNFKWKSHSCRTVHSGQMIQTFALRVGNAENLCRLCRGAMPGGGDHHLMRFFCCCCLFLYSLLLLLFLCALHARHKDRCLGHNTHEIRKALLQISRIWGLFISNLSASV